MTAILFCSKHDIPRNIRSNGKRYCKICSSETNKQRALKKISFNLSAGVCNKHNSEKYWTSEGRSRCRDCKREYDLKFRDLEYHRWLSINDRCYNPNHPHYRNYGLLGKTVFEDWRRDPHESKEYNLKAYEKFKTWIDENIGSCPGKDYSLDRVDNSRGYEPGNLKWSTRKEQNNNKRTNIKNRTHYDENSVIFFNGVNMSLEDFSSITEIPLVVVVWRYAINWDSDWILFSKNDNRMYEYKDNLYNLTELALISEVNYKTIGDRLRKGWSVEEAIETPVRNIKPD